MCEKAYVSFGSTFDEHLHGRMRASVVATGIGVPTAASLHLIHIKVRHKGSLPRSNNATSRGASLRGVDGGSVHHPRVGSRSAGLCQGTMRSLFGSCHSCCLRRGTASVSSGGVVRGGGTAAAAAPAAVAAAAMAAAAAKMAAAVMVARIAILARGGGH